MVRVRRTWLIQSVLSALGVFLAGALATSCGGGSSGGGGGGGTVPPAPVPPAPAPPSPGPSSPAPGANGAPVIHQVYGGPTSLTLSGPGAFSIGVQATDPEGDPLTYQWFQVAGPAAAIRSPQADYSIVDVQPPAAGQTVVLTFRARVSDPTHSVDSPDFSVTITGHGSGGGSSAITVTDQDLTYDELGRLTEASLNGGAVRIRYQYDDDGNLMRREVVR